MLAKNQNLPDEDRVVRNVPWTKLLRDEDDSVLGFLPQAFQLRADPNSPSGWEESLSVNWVEFFKDPVTRVRDCVWAMRKARTPGKRSVFAIGNVGKIKATCLARGYRVRILYEPIMPDEPSHAGIRRLPPDDLTLLSALADEAFSEMIHNSEIPNEPVA